MTFAAAKAAEEGELTSMSTECEPTLDVVYRLKITIPRSKPPIWRRLQGSSRITLNDLHEILQVLMHWEKGYPYQFDDGLFSYGQDFTDDFGEFVPVGQDDSQTPLTEVASRVGACFDYNYRLDSITLEGFWLLRIREILSGSKGLRVPLCLGGKSAGPPEDFSGIEDYEDCLRSFRDRQSPRHQATCQLLSVDFEAFDMDEVNRRLALLETFQGQPELWRRGPSDVLAVGRPPQGGRWLYGSRSRRS